MAIDASVLINLAVVERLDLLGSLARFRFVVPGDALEEIERPMQRRRVNEALDAGHLTSRVLTAPSVLLRRADLLGTLDAGEAACLALAAEEGWWVACDEKRVFRRLARDLLGEDRILNTVGLFTLGIRNGYWTIEDADRAKDVLADNRFRVKLRSFRDVV